MQQAPKMTDEQRTEALKKAREVRQKRSEIALKLSMKIIEPEEVLANIKDDPIIGRMKVKAFISALPGMGKVKTAKLMEELGIQDSRRLQGLGTKQLESLKSAISQG